MHATFDSRKKDSVWKVQKGDVTNITDQVKRILVRSRFMFILYTINLITAIDVSQ